MIEFFIGIIFGVLLIAVPSFFMGLIVARRKDMNK
jgi:hypothetical protein